MKPITQAGRNYAPTRPAPNKRDIIQELRRTIRDPASPEAAVDDALEALIELAKLED